MTLTLTVRGGEGDERAAPHTMAIDETATIGRAPECTLVLGDAQRGISRIQACIERRGDTYVLVDAGSNPTLLNDEALGAGREAVLSNDDRIAIGAYTLVVSVDTVFAVGQTLMTQPAPSAPVPSASLPATPEFERRRPRRSFPTTGTRRTTAPRLTPGRATTMPHSLPTRLPRRRSCANPATSAAMRVRP